MAETKLGAAIMCRSQQRYGRHTSVVIRRRVSATSRAARNYRSTIYALPQAPWRILKVLLPPPGSGLLPVHWRTRPLDLRIVTPPVLPVS